MAQTVNVNFPMDADLKRSMEEVCSELGMSMKTAFTIFAKKVSREWRIPFNVSVDLFYSESNMAYLKHTARDVSETQEHFDEHELIEVRETKKRVTLAIFPSVYESMQKIAYVNRQSASDVVTELIAGYVKANEDKLKEYDKLKGE